MKDVVRIAEVGFAAGVAAVAANVIAVIPAQAATITVTATVCIDHVTHTSAPGPYGTTIDVTGGPC